MDKNDHSEGPICGSHCQFFADSPQRSEHSLRRLVLMFTLVSFQPRQRDERGMGKWLMMNISKS
jgi:hypothetical protein